ncbi:MAG: hypothetical protein Q7U38_16425 [Methylobacter sp.]|nr:hypothetical protein [Methylobacter sp.]MDP2097530.1 hypothetical protein [Methylobacter sp.]MDP2429371.1 hypothetical protein [Methylobacter sp.]MDP3053796.1 hypothetical protein [Methylobacter sp.]MDP3362779.1 hypothetical protein [Methylobacter sp.]
MKRTLLSKILLVILGALAVSACGQDPKPATSRPTVVKKYAQATVLEGAVSNDKGLIKTGTVAANAENGQLITQVTVDNGHYRVDIPADTVLPILLTFSAESGGEKLVAAVVHSSITQYEINPLSTAIAAAAKAMGGYTHANMTRAAERTVHTPDANKTTTGWRGDPTTQYGGWH